MKQRLRLNKREENTMEDKQREYAPGGYDLTWLCDWREDDTKSAWREVPDDTCNFKYFCYKCSLLRNEITPYCPWCGRKMINVYNDEMDDQPENLHTRGDRTI